MNEEIITSAGNKDVKLLRSLHERKYRKQTGWFLAEGMRICLEAVSLGYVPKRLVYAAGREDDKAVRQLMSDCLKAGGRNLAVTPDLLGRIARKDNPQMVIGAFEQNWQDEDIITPHKDKLWIALDRCAILVIWAPSCAQQMRSVQQVLFSLMIAQTLIH